MMLFGNPYKDKNGNPTNGSTTGCHLHFSIKVNNTPKDPLDFVERKEWDQLASLWFTCRLRPHLPFRHNRLKVLRLPYSLHSGKLHRSHGHSNRDHHANQVQLYFYTLGI